LLALRRLVRLIAALRQRPDYILVGEIRGKEAYVLFQAMATGHTTYSTVHADSAKSLIHRLEGKPIDIPRIMLQSLDIVAIHISTRVKGKLVRRCKQISEIIDIDPTTKEILTNEVFRWDPIEDRFIYTGKSYVLEGIRARWEMDKEEITREIRRRAEILEWMKDNNIRTFQEVAKAISGYAEYPEDFLKRMKQSAKPKEIIKDDGSKQKKQKEIEEISEETSHSYEQDEGEDYASE
jgi:flagellar protein FlaI